MFPVGAYNRHVFLKILVCDFSEHMKIPKPFNKMLGNDLPKEQQPKEFKLKTSGGRFWHVSMEKVDSLLYFRKGWKEFAEDNALQYGEILVFMYKGNFEFELLRFGRSCLSKGFAELDGRKESGKPRSQKDGRKHVQRPNRSTARSPETVGDEGRNMSPIQSDEEQQGQENAQPESQMKLDSVRKRKLEGESNEENLPDHKSSNSSYPSFSVTLQPTYVQTTFLNVPKQFVKTSGLKLQGKSIKLQASGKTWNAKLSVFPTYARMHSGWRTFVKDNSLHEQDTCRFELINDDDDITFRVTIVRNNS